MPISKSKKVYEPKVKSNEELQREAEGQQFIQAREKIATALQGQGASQLEANKGAMQEMSNQEITKQGISQGTSPTQVNVKQFNAAKNAQIDQLTQQTMPLPEPDISKEKTLNTQMAETGLIPAVGFGNLIGQTLLKPTIGENKFQPQTTEELAQTPFGKVLGTATFLVDSALAIKLTSGKTLGLRVSAGGLLTGGGVLGVFNVKSKFSDAKSIISDSATQSSQVIDAVDKGLISPEEGLSQFNKIQANVNSAKKSIAIINKDKIQNFINGGKDASVEIEYAAWDMEVKRRILINLLMARGQQPLNSSDTSNSNGI